MEWKKKMDKYKIVALFGPAGSGKDYIQKKIMETDFGKKNLSKIISCTTRPPREGEIDGVHYYFKSKQSEFFSVPLIECTCFRGWWYGTSTDHLNKNKINIGVFNIKGIYQILGNKEIDCLPIRIVCYNKLRLMRQLNRESNPDCDEICRRFQADQKDFSNLDFSYKIIENNTNETLPAITDLFNNIREWSKQFNDYTSILI